MKQPIDRKFRRSRGISVSVIALADIGFVKFTKPNAPRHLAAPFINHDRAGINHARGANRPSSRLSLSLFLSHSPANFERVSLLLTSPRRLMSGYQRGSPHILPTRARGSRLEGDGASGVGGGGVGRARKIERKGREVVSCRTLDEAHARCEAARAFMRAEIGGSGTRTTASPGRPRRPGRRRRRADLSPRPHRTSSESGYGPRCPAAAVTVVIIVAAAAAAAVAAAAAAATTTTADHAAHMHARTYTYTHV